MPTTRFLPDFYWYRPKGKLARLILSSASRRVAVTFLHLFSSLYIYKTLLKFNYQAKLAIISVFFYYILIFVIKTLVQFVSEDLSRKIGFKNIIRLSALPFLFFIPCLILASDYPLFFLPACFFWAMHIGLYWWGYHGYFIKKAEKDHFGLSLGEADLLNTAASILAPIVGALVATCFGFPVLFLSSAVFMLVSLFALGKGSETRQKHDVKTSQVIKLVKRHKAISLAYVGAGGEAVVASVVWPMFLFLFFGKIVSLGIVVSVAALISAIFALAIGDRTDRLGERSIVSAGMPIVFISWIMRLIDPSLLIFTIADGIRNFGQRMVAIPLMTLTYKKALEAESAKAILFYEITHSSGVLLALIILSFWVFFGGDLSFSFILASIFSLLPLVAVVKGRLHNLNEKGE